MSEQYVAEIRAFGFNFAPLDWAQCNGQTVAISQNTTLFAIIGTIYGGNGTTTFMLPNLQDRTAAGMGQGLGLRSWPLGGVMGEAAHTLLIGEVPQHNHSITAGAGVPFAQELHAPDSQAYYGRWDGRGYAANANTILAPTSVGVAGGSQPHQNVQPTTVVNYCIALFGIFPTQN